MTPLRATSSIQIALALAFASRMVVAQPQSTFPSLAQAISLARERAPQVVSAKGMTGVALSSRSGARLSSLTNPYLEVFADRGSVGTRDLTLNANLWIPVEVGGQRSLRIAESDALIAWAGTGLDAARATAMAEVVRAYGSAIVASERVKISDVILTTARNESALYQARLEAKDATVLDARLASLEVSRNQAALTEAQADLSRALADLARLTGENGYVAPDPATPLDPPTPRTDASSLASIERAIDRSPHVQSSVREAEYRSREADRVSRDSHSPLNLILSAGRGDLGEARLGGGIAWTFPVLRSNQGEQARAQAERVRAVSESEVQRRSLAAALRGYHAELTQVRSAIDEIGSIAELTAQAIVDAAIEMQRAGKGEYLRVLVLRRDLAVLRARRLDLVKRLWSITADIVAITGEAP